MNREERRRAHSARNIQKAKKLLQEYSKMANASQIIKNGDMIRLDVDRIINRKDYSCMSDSYRHFVENNRDTVFEAYGVNVRRDGFSPRIGLKGVLWQFWYGDLIRVDSAESKVGEQT